MLTHARRRMFEVGISTMLSHRLAKQIVQSGIKMDTPEYDNMCNSFIGECRSIMHEFGLPEQQVERILKFVVPQAENEVLFYEMHKKFSTDGADQIKLEIALAIKIEQLKAL